MQQHASALARSSRAALAIVLLLLAPAARAAIPGAERDALTALFHATGGPDWVESSEWLGPAGTECSWYGVTCSEDGAHVTELWLGANGLRGPLPPALGALASLKTLWMHDNALTSIPPELAALSDLVSLNLATNAIEGGFPDAIVSLRKLEFLSLAGNALSGPIPHEIGSLLLLGELHLGYNSFSGTIPSSIALLPELTVLSIEWNELTGPIPPEIGSMARLTHLFLSHNRLSGTIPPALAALPLVHLFLDDNALWGPIPPQLGSAQTLEGLYLSRNGLTGTIPLELGSLARLETLELFDNLLEGPIPPELAAARNLQWLDAGGNRLTGSIPPQLGGLADLRALVLYENSLSGEIPPELGRLTTLRWLALSGNELSGPIPPEIGALTALETLSLASNRLSGPIPSVLGQHSNLTTLSLGDNPLEGEIPPALMQITSLESLDIGWTLVSGELPRFTSLQRIAYLNLEGNHLTGTIPADLGSLTGLIDLRLGYNRLSGSLPESIGTLTKLETLLIPHSGIGGSIPDAIGALASLQVVSLDGNSLSGTIPPSIGALSNLRELHLANNRLTGPLPDTMPGLTGLDDAASDFDYNALWTNDSALAAFLDSKQHDGSWADSQTVAPTGVSVTAVTDRSAVIAWSPIAYTSDDGGYQVAASLVPRGSIAASSTTWSKESTATAIRGLSPRTRYFVRVRSVTQPHGSSEHLTMSDWSSEVELTTGEPAWAPAAVEVTARPGGLLQAGGVALNTDSFVLSNYGDAPTAITLTQEGGFFQQSPASFVLDGNSSRIVSLTSLPSPADSHWGYSIVSGAGVPVDTFVDVHLLSTVLPTGAARAEPVMSRVEVYGEPNTDSVGTVAWRNSGTVPFDGLVVSDVPWIEVAPETGSIEPGETRAVPFTVVRSKRGSDTSAEGSVTGSVRLLFAAGTSAAGGGVTMMATMPVGVSRVTIVDTAKPAVTSGAIPPLAAGEVARFVPGIIPAAGGSHATVSLANAAGGAAPADLKLYLTTAAGTPKSGTFPPIQPGRAVAVSNVGEVFGAGGQRSSLQIRTLQLASVAVSAFLSSGSAVGQPARDFLPILRSERAVPAGEVILLTGIRTAAPHRSEIYIQEATGSASSARCEFFDADGSSLGRSDHPLPPFGLAVVTQIPAGSVSATIAATAAAGRIVASALARNEENGSSWPLVDWSRYHALSNESRLMAPVVVSSTASRRRIVRLSRSGPAAAPASTSDRIELFVFNGSSTPAAATLRFVPESGRAAERRMSLPPHSTMQIPSLAEWLGGTAGLGRLFVIPGRGALGVSARLVSGGGARSAAIPFLGAESGLAPGQARTFAGIDDASSEAIAARAPGSSKTSLVLLESGGSSSRVRISLRFQHGRSVVGSATVHQEFDLAAGGMLVIDRITTAVLGAARDSAWGELHGVQLEVQPVGGEGTVIPLLVVRASDTDDVIFRAE
jgi:Leucine-rich repeat (LRR) protein